MKCMKKSVFLVCALLMICCLSVVSVAAIDTPWVPMAPDSEAEEDESITDEPSIESNPNDTDEIQSSQGDGAISSEQNETTSNSATEQVTDTPKSSEPKPGGCNGSVNGYQWIMATVCVSWMFCRKARKEKEVNG